MSVTDEDPMFFMDTLLTIKTRTFSEVVIIYQCYDIGGMSIPHLSGSFYSVPRKGCVTEASHRCMQFKVFSEMQKAQDFRLVLCAAVWDSVRGYAERELERAVAAEKANAGFDFASERLVICSQRTPFPTPSEAFRVVPSGHLSPL